MNHPVPPYLFNAAPAPRARRWAEAIWAMYPPVALLAAAAMLAGGGCRNDGAAASGDSARLARQSSVTEPGNAERLEDPAFSPVAEGEPAPATTPEQAFAAYPSELPLVGTAAARGTVRYGKNRLDIANLSKIPWPAARVWINQSYSVQLPYTRPGEIRSVHFGFFRDEEGRAFPTDNRDVRIEALELVQGDERTRVRFGLEY